MKVSTEYGYLIKALREYPFESQVKDILHNLRYPVPKGGIDPNWWISPQNLQKDPKVLTDMIKIETNSKLIKYRHYHQAISEMIDETDPIHWKIIKVVYIHNECNVTEALKRYGFVEKTQGYKNIVRPFFENLEWKLDEIIARETFPQLFDVKKRKSDRN